MEVCNDHDFGLAWEDSARRGRGKYDCPLCEALDRVEALESEIEEMKEREVDCECEN